MQRLTQELNQIKTDLKLERTKTCDLGFALQDKETEMEEHRKRYEREMRDLVSRLLLLEADFRKEQREIQCLLNEKDDINESLRMDVACKTQILDSQKAKIESLKRYYEEEIKAKELKMESQKQDLEALKRANARLIESLSQVRPAQNNSAKQAKARRSSTPNPPRAFHRLGKKAGSPGWTEELSEFF